MSITTYCNISFFTQEKERIEKIKLEGRADYFIYNLIDDAGVTFKPDAINDFSEKEKKILKVYYDENSASVMEGYASVTLNIQNPEELKIAWVKIRTGLIIEFDKTMKLYHEKISGDPPVKISEFEFNNKMFRYTWSLVCISGVLSLLQMAILNNNLVEVTVTDF